MSFFRAQRAQALRSSVCSSDNLAICTDFRRIGVNQITFVNQVTTPSAPTIVSSSITGTTLTINFTPGSTGGNPIINYQYSLNNGVTYTVFSPPVITSPITITGLTAGSSYSVLLQAVNSVGIGEKSGVLSVNVPTAPLAPFNLNYTTSNGSATISFNAGLNGGSDITNFRYSIDAGSTFNEFSPVKTVSPVTISGLTAGQTYSVVLQAVNALGNGVSSSALSVIMPTSTPSAPTNLSSSNVGSTSLTVSFSAGSNGGSAITNYKYSTNGTTYNAVSPASTSTSINITGLSSGTTYNISIKAVNANGDGTASSALSVKTASIPGSLLFGGSTRELALNPGVSMGSGAYTVECWFYNNSGGWVTAAPNFAGLLGHSMVTGSGVNVSGGLAIWFTDDKTVGTDRNGGDMRPTYSFTNAITLNAWHHFALVRNSSLTETVFIDGVKASGCGGGGIIKGEDGIIKVGQQTNSKDYNGNSVEIGHFYEGYWPGYLTNFRIVAGTAVYDPNADSITVPTSPLTNITGTKYLMVGNTVTGDGSSTQTVTNTGNVTLSTSIVPF